jgi:hypothetical protein
MAGPRMCDCSIAMLVKGTFWLPLVTFGYWIIFVEVPGVLTRSESGCWWRLACSLPAGGDLGGQLEQVPAGVATWISSLSFSCCPVAHRLQSVKVRCLHVAPL